MIIIMSKRQFEREKESARKEVHERYYRNSQISEINSRIDNMQQQIYDLRDGLVNRPIPVPPTTGGTGTDVTTPYINYCYCATTEPVRTDKGPSDE